MACKDVEFACEVLIELFEALGQGFEDGVLGGGVRLRDEGDISAWSG